ncbi:hypothetical protein KC19_2G251200 [Ceratodon purpureus]|uniref:Uncharacterized protein n=1 Tax=Ceratodon purpureus TaxID=3225 RepID=A0A8T0J098_CERPU|nr:hypothetical protein KC19_2G251200 [Ceratodon purpureus]
MTGFDRSRTQAASRCGYGFVHGHGHGYAELYRHLGYERQGVGFRKIRTLNACVEILLWHTERCFSENVMIKLLDNFVTDRNSPEFFTTPCAPVPEACYPATVGTIMLETFRSTLGNSQAPEQLSLSTISLSSAL